MSAILVSRFEKEEHGETSLALMVNQDAEPGQIIHQLSGTVVSQPTRYTIQTGKFEHVEDNMGIYINHHCIPNACVRGQAIQAICRIPKGSEVSIDYNDSEDHLSHPFVCNCCGQIIIGSKIDTKVPFDTGDGMISIVRRQLDSQGVTYLPKFLSDEWRQILLEEQSRLKPHAKEKNFALPPFNTLRISQVIGGVTISAYSPTILALYEYTRQKIQKILGFPLYRCPNDQELAVLNYFHRTEAEHGWHMDDPSYVLVISLLSPDSPAGGGQVEWVPGVVAGTGEAIELAVSSATEEGRTRRLFLRPCDAYLIRGDKTLHRVTPLRNGERLIIAFSFDDTIDKQYEGTADILYA
jgi:hypothetical protein